MASHDFCQGCEKCDKYYQDQEREIRRDGVRKAINELKNLEPHKNIENAQEKIETVIAMLMLKLEAIK